MKISPIIATSLFLIPAAHATDLKDEKRTIIQVRPSSQAHTNTATNAVPNQNGRPHHGRHQYTNTQDFDNNNRGSLGGTDIVGKDGGMGFLAMLRAGPDDAEDGQNAAPAPTTAPTVRTTPAAPKKCVWWNPCTWCRSGS
jgi:hypothetical protein